MEIKYVTSLEKKKKKKVSWRRSKKVPSSVFRSVFRIIFRIVFRIVLVKPTNAYVCRLGLLVSLPPALSPSRSLAGRSVALAKLHALPVCVRARFSGGSFPFVLLLVRSSPSCLSLPLSDSAFFFFSLLYFLFLEWRNCFGFGSEKKKQRKNNNQTILILSLSLHLVFP